MYNISLGDINEMMLPLPPLAEQRRIVAKIDELMARVDELERKRDARNEKRFAMHQAAIARLLDAGDANASRTGRDFIFAHFGELYGTKENVAELRKAILQLAVMGRLVPQDPKDQPTSELLKEIEAEKKRLVQEGKIKEPKPLPPIKPEEVPYQVPKGWEWVRLGVIAEILGGFAYPSEGFKNNGSKQVIRLGNIRPDILRIDESPVFITDSMSKETQNYLIKRNDILITMTGTRDKRDYLYSVIIDEQSNNDRQLFLNQRVGAIRSFQCSQFLNKAFKVNCLRDEIFESSTGSANQANIGMVALKNWRIPLPPLAEQNRIVAKVDELMALCDKLDKQIDERTAKESALLEAVAARV